MQQLISIIMPIYNAEKYLARSVNCILNQTYRNLEVILINDGSKDNSGLICDDFAKLDSRVKVITQINAGVSDARNKGLSLASGDWIGFFDADDWAEPDMFEKLIQAALKQKKNIAVCGFIKYSLRGKKYKRTLENLASALSQKQSVKYLMCDNYYEGFMWNKLYSTKRLIDLSFDTQLHFCEDLLFNTVCFTKAGGVAVVNDALYHYELNESNATTNFNDKRMTELLSRQKVIDIIADTSFCKRSLYIAQCYYTNAAFGLLRYAFEVNDCEKIEVLQNETSKCLKMYMLSKSIDIRKKVKAVLLLSMYFWKKIKWRTGN